MGLPARATPASLLDGVSTGVRSILERALAGTEITASDAELLFGASAGDVHAVLGVADALCLDLVGEDVTFVVNRNINFTNVCTARCGFCAFSRSEKDADAYRLSLQEIVARACEAADLGATEVCLQGGLHPGMDGMVYCRMVSSIKNRLPDIHVHGFSPFEVWYGARRSGMSHRKLLRELKARGLGSMPGTAAEILDVTTRRRLAPKKISAAQWVEIIETAHAMDIPTTATIMYGHLDGPPQWARHLNVIREIQKQTAGFTEFVPLGFVHSNTRLYREQEGVRPGPDRRENLLMHAVARIFFGPTIPNIQVSWVKLGLDLAKEILRSGANDLGGTLMNENISRSAGAMNGEAMTRAQLQEFIESLGRVAVERDTLYQHVGHKTGPPRPSRCV